MRFVSFDDWRVGVLRDDGIHEVSRVVAEPWRGRRRAMNWLVRHFDEVRHEVERVADGTAPVAVDSVRLRPPVPMPTQLMAAPSNNAAHAQEMKAVVGRDRPRELQSPREVGFFLKAPGSLIGPADTIELPPLPGRRFDHESELAVVIGREARGVRRGEALDYVFGYTCLIDVTLRAGAGRNEERPQRKSYATFSPVGPTVVTADESPDPSKVTVRLWVGGQLRQDARISDLIVPVPELLELASHVLPLQPGDLYTTGSPAGVGPIEPGDTLEVDMDVVGRMSLPVRARAW
jgi:2-keto-4-pentenoate hydratase/2-oxohepta-3-ene-1,7-dioic acid hydratase in catechol pathway